MKQTPVIYNLPDDFSSAEEHRQSVIIRSYQSQQTSPRNKSILNQNMIDMLISGKKNILDISNMSSLQAGELMLLAKGNSIISTAVPESNLFSSIVIYFTNEVFASFLIKYNDLIKDKSKNKIPKNPFLTYKQDGFILNYIQSLKLLLRSPSPCPPELKLLKLEELLLYLLNQDVSKLQSLAVAAIDNGEMQLRRAAESNIGTRVTVEELAFLCNTSLSSFKRKFNKIYGTSPQRWFVQQKMQLAANFLKHPGETPGSVYEKIGYESYSSFSNAFKQQFGMTPKVYREQNLSF